jgi:predicted acyltransferase
MNPRVPGNRLQSLDVFRGATLASMVLVNNPGSWEHIYPQLEHAAWHGWTFTDTVFPFFLWIAGVALTLSFAKRVERGDGRAMLLFHVLRRSLLIFAVGLFLNGFPYFHLDRIRYLGVLQRIAICYLICASLFLVLKIRGLIIAIVTLLAGYWLLMMLVPVPGCGAGHLDKDCNLEKYVDGIFLTGHMWSQTRVWDPEGLVSTIPAIGTMLFGILAGYFLRSNRPAVEKTVRMFVTGNLLLLAGLVMNVWLPINKSLWTSSYSVYMAGLASMVFALCYWVVDVRERHRWSRFFAIYGMNALAVFIFTGVIGRLLGIVKIGGQTLEVWIFENLFAPVASPINASLLYAIVNVFFYFLIVFIMYRRGWFLRV